ncbi:MAG: YkvA family protein [Halobacteriales archaeon]
MRSYRQVISRLGAAIDRARAEVTALAVALRDPRTPWYAKLVAALTVGLAVSPLDPIPDVIPVLGHLDDAVFIPLGASLAWRLTPAHVKADAREQAAGPVPAWAKWTVAGLVGLAWLSVGYAVLELLI